MAGAALGRSLLRMRELRSVECFNYAASVYGYILLYSVSDNIVDVVAGVALGRSLLRMKELRSV